MKFSCKKCGDRAVYGDICALCKARIYDQKVNKFMYRCLLEKTYRSYLVNMNTMFQDIILDLDENNYKKLAFFFITRWSKAYAYLAVN
jgi:hypothetical protein